MIVTRITEIEQALMRTLERERCTSEQGCSALANVLLAAFATCRRDPRIAAGVSEEMRRLAAMLTDLAGKDPAALDQVLTDSRRH